MAGYDDYDDYYGEPARRGQGQRRATQRSQGGAYRAQGQSARRATSGQRQGTPRHASQRAQGYATASGYTATASPRTRQGNARRSSAGGYRGAQQRRPQQRKASVLPYILLGVLGVALVVAAIVFVPKLFGGKSSGGEGEPIIAEDGTVISEGSAAEPAAVTINTLMVGDMLMHHGVWESGEHSPTDRNYDHLFAHIADDLAWADIAMLDQETPVNSTDTHAFTGYPVFCGPLEVTDAEAKAGFNVILHASNHAVDQGYDGLRAELNHWHEAYPDVQVIGAYLPDEQVAADMGPAYYEKDGFKVAILNYTYDLNGYSDPSDAVCEIDRDQIAKDVAIAEENADLTIVCPHWGIENELSPNEYQTDLAKYMCDLGVDLIIGNHPHVIQPVSLIKGDSGNTCPVFWSTGNFISTMDTDKNLIGGIAKAVLTKDQNGARVSEVTFTPIVAKRAYTVSSNGINDISEEDTYNADLTTYKLMDYTDEIAATNAWRPADSRPTHAWCVEFCKDVLGEGFDGDSCVFTLNLDPASAWNLGSAVSEGEAESAEASA